MPSTAALHLAVALDGAGWHPAAWRRPEARPRELFTAAYWSDLIRQAERGLLDFVTIEDALGVQSTRFDGPDGRTDQVRGRLDALLLAAHLAPLTSHIGLVPTVTTTHTEPFHVSKVLATLDHVSAGRAGWRVQVSSRAHEAAHFGRRRIPPFRYGDPGDSQAARVIGELFDEAADVVEVVRRLWDSWEDDAVIRDVATGRFVDRDRLHYIDFTGKWFTVKGPSITPRPPQGQPVVSVLAHTPTAYRLAARAADVVFVTPSDADEVRSILAAVQAAQDSVGRDGDPLKVFAELVVFLDRDAATAARRRAALDELSGAAYSSDAVVFAGSAEQLADLALTWQRAGIDGLRLRPATVPHDLTLIVDTLVPELQARGAFRRSYQRETLRGRLGLTRPPSRYASTAAAPIPEPVESRA